MKTRKKLATGALGALVIVWACKVDEVSFDGGPAGGGAGAGGEIGEAGDGTGDAAAGGQTGAGGSSAGSGGTDGGRGGDGGSDAGSGAGGDVDPGGGSAGGGEPLAGVAGAPSSGGSAGAPAGGEPGASGSAGESAGGSAGASAAGGSAGEPNVLGELGDSCSGDDECESDHCVDDVCCEESCDGECEHCVSDGQCEMPDDDPVCGAVGCVEGTNQCVDYDSELTTDRCEAKGACSDGNVLCPGTAKPARTVCDLGGSTVSLCNSQGTCVAPTVDCGGSACQIGASDCCFHRVASSGAVTMACEPAADCGGTFIAHANAEIPVRCDEHSDCQAGKLCSLLSASGNAYISCVDAEDAQVNETMYDFYELCLSPDYEGTCSNGNACTVMFPNFPNWGFCAH